MNEQVSVDRWEVTDVNNIRATRYENFLVISMISNASVTGARTVIPILRKAYLPHLGTDLRYLNYFFAKYDILGSLVARYIAVNIYMESGLSVLDFSGCLRREILTTNSFKNGIYDMVNHEFSDGVSRVYRKTQGRSKNYISLLKSFSAACLTLKLVHPLVLRYVYLPRETGENEPDFNNISIINEAIIKCFNEGEYVLSKIRERVNESIQEYSLNHPENIIDPTHRDTIAMADGIYRFIVATVLPQISFSQDIWKYIRLSINKSIEHWLTHGRIPGSKN